MKSAICILTGIFFAILALIQASRLYLDFPIVLGTWPMPLGASLALLLVTLLLSFWMFYRAKKDY